MSRTADAIVIGSGALGGATALALARQGHRTLLLDRHAIASQTSPRAAGLSAVMRTTALMTRLAQRGVALLGEFQAETGIDIGLHRSGSLKLARGDAMAHQLGQELARANTFGVVAGRVDAAEARRMMPFLRADHAALVVHYPEDVYLDPALFTIGLAEAARRHGCTAMPQTEVTEIVVACGRVAGVRVADGVIAAPIVVDAAGAWARAIAASASLPMLPVRHQLLVTRPLPEVAPEQPVTRILDAQIYVRPCDGGLMLGGYEPDPMLFDAPPDDVAALPLDRGVLERLAAAAHAEFPIFADLDGAKLRGGLPTMTLDDEHLIGPVPDVAGLFVIGGCNVGGLSTALAFAEALVEMIADPLSADAYTPLLPSRFAGTAAPAEALRAACRLHYAQHYVADRAGAAISRP